MDTALLITLITNLDAICGHASPSLELAGLNANDEGILFYLRRDIGRCGDSDLVSHAISFTWEELLDQASTQVSFFTRALARWDAAQAHAEAEAKQREAEQTAMRQRAARVKRARNEKAREQEERAQLARLKAKYENPY